MKIDKSISVKFWKKWILKKPSVSASCLPAPSWTLPALPSPAGGSRQKRFPDVPRTVTVPPVAAGVSVWETFQHKGKNSSCPMHLDHELVLAAAVCRGAGANASLQENRSEAALWCNHQRVISENCPWTTCKVSSSGGWLRSAGKKLSDKQWTVLVVNRCQL